MMNQHGRLWLAGAAIAAFGLACSSSSSNNNGTTSSGTGGVSTTTTGASATTTGASATAGNGSTTSASATATATSGTTTSSATAGGSTSGSTTGSACVGSLFTCYGGAPTVQAVVSGAETALLNDCVTAPYFAGVVSGDPKFESVGKLTGCLNLFFAAGLGDTAAHYPGVAGYPEYDSSGNEILGNVASDGDGGWVYDTDAGAFGAFTCENMRDAHSNAASHNVDLGITPEVFNEFLIDVGGVLAKAGVATKDIQTIAGAVAPFEGEIVSYYPSVNYACGGSDGGIYVTTDAGTIYPGANTETNSTLWTKYGGGPTIAAVVGQAEGVLLSDCVTAPYFAGVVAGSPGYESVNNLTACLNLFFSAAFGNTPAGAAAFYPGVGSELANDANGVEIQGSITTGNAGNTLTGMGYYFNTNNPHLLSPTGALSGFQCQNMLAAHNALPDGGGNVELGITPEVFNEFIVDVANVALDAGVSGADLTPLGTALGSFQTQVVAPQPEYLPYFACDGGGDVAGPDGGVGNGPAAP